VRRLWPGAGIWIPLPFVAWTVGWLVAGKVRGEHLAFALLVPLLAYTNAKTKRLLIGLLPLAILALVYDGMRWIRNVGVTPDRVHLCDLRALDMRIASATVGGEPGTVHDWVQAHVSPTLDLVFAIPYGTFLYVVIGFAVFLYVKDYPRMLTFGWAFLIVNLAGFVTYHLYPAAPPWYFHAHGCAVDLSARASEGANLARVDRLLGVHYFQDFYGRSSDVFGAVPSLHVSYPLLIVLFGWPVLRWPGRGFACAFLASMCTAAVYLDHHWILDVLIGLAYAVAGFVVVLLYTRSPASAKSAAPETAS
jgi:hypothetical protein